MWARLMTDPITQCWHMTNVINSVCGLMMLRYALDLCDAINKLVIAINLKMVEI